MSTRLYLLWKYEAMVSFLSIIMVHILLRVNRKDFLGVLVGSGSWWIGVTISCSELVSMGERD